MACRTAETKIIFKGIRINALTALAVIGQGITKESASTEKARVTMRTLLLTTITKTEEFSIQIMSCLQQLS
jgi:hypothetical protein